MNLDDIKDRAGKPFALVRRDKRVAVQDKRTAEDVLRRAQALQVQPQS